MRLNEFKAVYCSGIFIPEPEAVSALSLLFEKIYLPNNIEIVREFSKNFRITTRSEKANGTVVSVTSEDGEDAFQDLEPEQRETAHNYIAWGMEFAYRNATLFGEVFESESFPDGNPLEVKLIKQGAPGQLNTYEVSFRQHAQLVGDDEDRFPKLLEEGYVPVVGRFRKIGNNTRINELTAKQLAALLAMKSIEMIIPRTLAVHSEVILEARTKLKDQLPPFWSAMFKLSVELKKRINESTTSEQLTREAIDLVDTLVRPAITDLWLKLEKERKDWFYKILSPVQKGIKLFVSNPPITQQQLITNSLVLASDTCMSIAENMRAIESLKRDAGITYLIDLSTVVDKSVSKKRIPPHRTSH